MATIIQFKRSSGTSAPATLKLGELAYTYGTGTQGNLGDRLFIGEGGETDGNANNITVIGGEYFTNQLDHAQGTLTASSALLVDSNKAIDEIFIGNALATGGTLKLNEGTNNGTNFVGLKAPNSITTSVTFTLPSADGTNGQLLTTDGSGNLSFTSAAAGTFDLAADSGSNDTFTTGNTLTFAGGTGIDTTVSDDQISIAIDSSVLTNSSTHTLTNKTFDANGTGNSISNIEVADFASGVLDTDLSSVAGTDTTLASAKAIKAYVDAQNANQMTTFTISDDSSTTSTITQSDTLQFLGGIGIGSTVSGDTVTFAIDATVATLTGSQTLQNKVIDSANNTLTLDLSEGTLTGTTAEFNTALSDGSFATLAGTETLTNKTLTGPIVDQIEDANGNELIIFNTTASAVNEITYANAAASGAPTISTTGSDTNINLVLSPKGSGTIDVDTSKIVNVTDPTANQDAATKAYVDAQVSSGSTLTIAADTGSNDTVTVDSDTLTFAGTTNEIETTVTNNQIQIGLPDDVTIGGDATITGNLTVNGTTTTLSTTNSVVSDSLIELNNGAASNANDLGLIFERGSTGDNAVFAWDESADKFTLGTTTATGASTGDLTITSGTLVAALEGNASTATALQTARNIAIAGDVVGTASFDGTGDISITATIQADSVALGTDTTGNYVATIADAGSGRITVANSGTESAAVTLDIANNAVTLGTHTSGDFVGTITGGAGIASTGATTGETISHTLSVDLTDTSVFNSDGTVSTAVVLDGSGDFTANMITSDLTGDVTGTADVATCITATANNATNESVFLTFVDGATGTQGIETDTGLTYNPSTNVLTTTTFSGALSGNATTATALETARAIEVSGAVTGTANFDGSAAINIVTTATADPTITLAGDLTGSATLTNLGNATLTATIAANSVALGTDTTGNYMSDATGGDGITVTHTPAEGSSAAIAVDLTDTAVFNSDGTVSTAVVLDGSGDFTANAIT